MFKDINFNNINFLLAIYSLGTNHIKLKILLKSHTNARQMRSFKYGRKFNAKKNMTHKRVNLS